MFRILRLTGRRPNRRPSTLQCRGVGHRLRLAQTKALICAAGEKSRGGFGGTTWVGGGGMDEDLYRLDQHYPWI